MTSRQSLADHRRDALFTLSQLVLPPWKRTDQTSLRRLSGLLGTVLFVFGAMLFIIGGLNYSGAFADRSSSAFWEHAQTDGAPTFEEKLAFNWSGALGFVSFLFTPTAWLAMYCVAEGTVRAAGYWSTGETTGSLLAYPACWLTDLTLTTARRLRREREFGLEVPDRIEANPSLDDTWSLAVVSSRDKTWRDVEAIAIGDSLYELIDAGQIRENGRLRVRYRLRPWPESRIVRTVVDYEPPTGCAVSTGVESRRPSGPQNAIPPVQHGPK